MSLATPAEFVSSLYAHEIDPSAFCTHLLHQATTGQGTVSTRVTAEEFDIDVDGATHLYQLASEFNLISYTGPDAGTVEVNQNEVTQFKHFLDVFTTYLTSTELDLLAEEWIHDAELSIAVPDEFDGRSADLMARLTRLVQNAESELLVVTPFFTRFGVDIFVNHLARATDRGVLVTILTRDASGDGDNVEYINTIRETIAESGTLSNLRVYEYDSEFGRLHAKALVADEDKAYVGSANLTTYSLQEAIEIGLIVQGPVVQDLAEFFTTVQNSTNTTHLGDRIR